MTTTDQPEIPEDIIEALLKLEAKQVLRGFKSELFPNMTYEQALSLRSMNKEQLKKLILEYGKLKTL